jgi:hypothetical protein
MTFKLGLFENPYVDESAAGTIVRSTDNLTKGFNAMKRAIVLVDNRPHEFPPPATGFFAPPDPAPPVMPLRGTIEEAQRCGAGSTQNQGRVCVDDDFCGGATDSCTDVGGYALNDWDLDGTVEVYFDGIDDHIVVAAPTDPMAGILGGYDYTSTGDGTTTVDVVEVTDITEADIAVLRIGARRGSYFGLDAGVPLSFDGPFPGTMSEGSLGASIQDRNRVLDALRVRDGYTDSDGDAVAASNPDLRIALVMYMDRPGIVEPFIQGMATLDETLGEPGSYPLVSDVANHDPQGDAGVDAFLVDFGATDRALLDVLFDVNHNGVEYLQARLPMELPSSDEAVEAQYEDLPADSLDPTFTIGSGRGY